jgi:hypothetical protein
MAKIGKFQEIKKKIYISPALVKTIKLVLRITNGFNYLNNIYIIRKDLILKVYVLWERSAGP